MRGLRKGSKKRSEVLEEGVIGVKVRGLKEVKDRGSRFKGRSRVGGSV